MTARPPDGFRERYIQIALPRLREVLGRTNAHSLPRVLSVTVSAGVGKQRTDREFLADVERGLSLITGQKAAPTTARKAIAGFKVRKGSVVGYRCTLRGRRMEDFLTRLLAVVLPRVRDFRGVTPSSVDAAGNLTIGIKEASSFPEVDPASVERPFGLAVTIVTSAKSREEALELFRSLRFPLAE